MKPSPQFRVQSSLGFLLLAAVVAVASGQAPADRVGPLAALRAGMPVTLRETGGRFEIRVHEGLPGPLGHAVVRVGPDYVVVKNIAEVVEQWIPISAISSVTVMKIGK